MSLGLSNTKKLPDKKLSFLFSFFFFCKFGRGIEFLLECGLSLADRFEMECLQMAVLPFLPSLGAHQ